MSWSTKGPPFFIPYRTVPYRTIVIALNYDTMFSYGTVLAGIFLRFKKRTRTYVRNIIVRQELSV